MTRIVSDRELFKLRTQASILRDVVSEYPTCSVSNALRQIESRIEHLEKNHG